ncbi:MAG: hypothetical protein WCG98_05450 [bacterium]
MDVSELKKFFAYKPFLNKDPRLLLDTILEQAQRYLPKEQIPKIKKAYAYALAKHT